MSESCSRPFIQPALELTNSPLQSIDLTGSRDFLTKESTEEALKPMLASGAAIVKVREGTAWILSLCEKVCTH